MKYDHLIIFGGFSCSGKSFIMKKIRKGLCSEFAKLIGITSIDNWFFTQVSRLKYNTSERKIVCQFDMYGKYINDEKKFRYIEDLIQQSKKVTILTVYCPLKVMKKRLNQRILKMLYLSTRSRLGRFSRISTINIKKYRLMKQRQLMVNLKKRKYYKDLEINFYYDIWLEQTNHPNVIKHYLINLSKSDYTPPSTVPLKEITTFNYLEEI